MLSRQCERVLDYLRNHYYITAKEAMNDLGIFRLGARIWDLKKAGVPIQSGWKEVTNRFGETCRVRMYWLTGEPRKELENVK